jgi:DNA-3-methyladenine glycosylase
MNYTIIHQKKLTLSFYQKTETLQIARMLLGKHLFTFFEGQLTGGLIIETEAYKGIKDKASHAYNSLRTKRTEIMFAPGGVAYVYLCYGVHHLFNIVTHKEGEPHAILIRALKPTHGMETMLLRRKSKKVDQKLTGGPATLAQSLGITTTHSGLSLIGDQIWLEANRAEIPQKQISISPRIGIDYAEEDRYLPYRFRIK